jgi:hypothetical protein
MTGSNVVAGGGTRLPEKGNANIRQRDSGPLAVSFPARFEIVGEKLPPAAEVLYIVEPRLTPRHREGSRTLAAVWVSASERPVTGDRIPIRCSGQRQRVATRRSRHHLVIKPARHVAAKISGEGERPALRLSRYKARLVRRETKLAGA